MRTACRAREVGREVWARTLAPLCVESDDLIDKRHVSVAPPLALADEVRVAALIFTK